MSARTIQEDFEEFHRANPWVYDTLVALARDMAAQGHSRIGINMLWEVLRWQYMRRTVDKRSNFKLNDHYPSRYVRLIVGTCPDLADMFVVRELRAA